MILSGPAPFLELNFLSSLCTAPTLKLAMGGQVGSVSDAKLLLPGTASCVCFSTFAMNELSSSGVWMDSAVTVGGSVASPPSFFISLQLLAGLFAS